jgi:hypothetical protein
MGPIRCSETSVHNNQTTRPVKMRPIRCPETSVNNNQITRPVKMRPIRCPETSVNNYHTTPRNIPEDRRSQPQSIAGLNIRYACVLPLFYACNVESVSKHMKCILYTANLLESSSWLYAPSSWFDSRLGHQVFWFRFIVVFLSPSTQMTAQHLRLIHDLSFQNCLH